MSSEVYMGTSEGYIFNTENENVSDAKVIATVNTCSVGCSRETISEPSGYYMTANLNLAKLSMLSVYAEKQTALGLEYGTATGLSNEFQAANIDVRICLPPPSPDLVDETNTHQTSVTLSWTSYADKKNYPVYDEFQFDSNIPIRLNNPGNKNRDVSGLSFSNHIWRVRTCNNFCCSAWVNDYFTVGNTAPDSPVLKNQSDTVPGKINFEWTSGIESDGDQTYDEYEFGIFDQLMEKISPANSPISKIVFGCNFYKWRVRTCETASGHLCSAWSEDSFFACGAECPACTPIGRGGSSGGSIGSSTTIEKLVVERYVSNVFYALFVNSPQSVNTGGEFKLKVSFSTTVNAKDLIFKVNSSYFEMNDYIITEIENKNAKFNMTGRAKNAKPGMYFMNLDVYLAGVKIISEPIEIEIKDTSFLEIPASNNYLWIILIIIVIIVIYFSYRYRKRYKETNS